MEEKTKIRFRNLSLPLKVLVSVGWVMVSLWVIVVFIELVIGLIQGTI